MFKNILVAFDGSEAARQGLATGLALATDQHATLFVLNVVEGMPAAWSPYVDEQFRPTRVQVLLEGLRAAAQKVLDEARDIALRDGQATKPLLVYPRGGSAADVILAQAREVNADIVVLGTHGRTGVSRLVTGSTAESVLRRAEVPVLLVRANAKALGPRIARPVTADCTERALTA